MSANHDARVIRTIAAMAEMHGKQLSPAAAQMYLEDLNSFTPDQVLSAFQTARLNLKYFPTIAEIHQIIKSSDGRPGVEEAWSLCPKSDFDSTVWTDEIAQAFAVASPLLDDGDKIGARMAFKEKYEALLKESRELGKPVKWRPSFGSDRLGRQSAIILAVDKKRMTVERAIELVPEVEFKIPNRITGPRSEDAAEIKKLIEETMKDLE